MAISFPTYTDLVVGMNFSMIPAGKFKMGSNYADETTSHPLWYADEKPIHEVAISESFYLSQYLVTISNFRVFVQDTGYKTDAEKAGESFGLYHEVDGVGSWKYGKELAWNNTGYAVRDDFPVTHVSWIDATYFCEWLTNINKENRLFYLPSEEQWEYSAGGVENTKYSWGNNLPNALYGGNIADKCLLSKYPNWKYPILNSYDDGYALVSPVAHYKPNTFGLFDMTGNVWEWVANKYEVYPNAPEDAINAYNANVDRITQGGDAGVADDLRVHRGGGFDWELPFLRVSKRRCQLKNFSAINIGFRIAITPPFNK